MTKDRDTETAASRLNERRAPATRFAAGVVSPQEFEPHAHLGGKVFEIFRKHQLGRRAVRPPRLDTQPIGDDREGDQRDVGKLVREFGKRARHMIGRGNDDERTETVFERPMPRLHRIAQCVLRRIVEVDAAGQHAVVVDDLARNLASRGAGIDAGDKQPLATAGGEQFERIADARSAAGQNHDAVGVAIERDLAGSAGTR